MITDQEVREIQQSLARILKAVEKPASLAPTITPDVRGLISSCLSEIKNLQAKLAAGEQEGWEGSKRRTVLKSQLEHFLQAKP